MTNAKKTVGILLYPGFEALDVFGPVEMWSYVPDFELVYFAQDAGPVMSTQKMAVVATESFASVPKLDLLMVPGGIGTVAELANTAFLDYLRRADAQTELTTSVCSGSALLAKAGLLTGRRATSNKVYFELAASQASDVDWVVSARWVEDGKYFTSSGVSAGADMALAVVAKLYGRDAAEAIANNVEYEWHSDPSDDPFAKFCTWKK